MRKASLAAAIIAVCGSVATAQSTVYAVNIRDGAHPLIKFPVTTPAYNVVAPSVTPILFALEFNADGSKLYCITNGAVGTMQLGTIDQLTGAFTAIGLIAGAGAAEANWGGLTFDVSTNTMFALAGANLYTVDLNTANTTLVAPIAGGPAGALYIDIAINNAGTLMIAHDIATDQMVSVDKTTGAATILGPTGFAANFAQGMDFDPATGVLYATIYTGGGTGMFCSVNTTTGACTGIVNTQTWTAAGPEMEMAIKAGGAAVTCYANCDNSTVAPCLNVNDFVCFNNLFAAGSSSANCDASTIAPILNVNDFICFGNTFAAGCGANNCAPRP